MPTWILYLDRGDAHAPRELARLEAPDHHLAWERLTRYARAAGLLSEHPSSSPCFVQSAMSVAVDGPARHLRAQPFRPGQYPPREAR